MALIAKIRPIRRREIFSILFMKRGVNPHTPPVPKVLIAEPIEMIKTFLLSVSKSLYQIRGFPSMSGGISQLKILRMVGARS